MDANEDYRGRISGHNYVHRRPIRGGTEGAPLDATQQFLYCYCKVE
jgi:hypothetical protein